MVFTAATRIFSAATSFLPGSGDRKDKASAVRDRLVRRTLGLAENGIPIGRETEPADYVRWQAAASGASNTGTTEGRDGAAGILWREYLWSDGASIDECQWEQVRWRFYATGLVCFEARMSNSSSRLDSGDVQGHRIELRERNGLLLGVWIAGFFVRRNLPMRGFATSFVDEHQPLGLHFSELEDTQSGAWICV